MYDPEDELEDELEDTRCPDCGLEDCECESLRCYECGNVIQDQYDHNRDCSFSPDYVRPI